MKNKIFRSFSIVAASTLFSRILGFIRDMVMGQFFGTDKMLDGFLVAFRIPNLFRRLVAEGSLTISFVPIYTEYLELKGEEEALKFAQKAFTLLLIVLFMLVSLGVVFSPALVSLLGFGFRDPELISSTVFMTRLMFPYLFLISLVAFCMGFLNSKRHFFAPAFSPVLLNIGFIIGILYFRTFFEYEATGIAVGVLLGGVMQLLLQVPYMIRNGFVLKWSLDITHPGIRRMMRMVSAAMAGGAVYQLNQVINTMLGSMLPGGSISYLYYSDRLTEMVMGIFVISIGNVILPELSSCSAQGDIDRLKGIFRQAVRGALFFALPAAVALAVSGDEIITVLFMRGKFDPASVANTYKALFFASFGLSFVALYKMLTQVFYSLKDTFTPVVTAGAAFLINAGLGYTLMHTSLLHAGLSLSNGIAMCSQVILLLAVLRKKIGRLGFRQLVIPLAKITVSASLMGLFLYYCASVLDFTSVPLVFKVINLGILVSGGGLVYLCAAFVLKVPEIHMFTRILSRKKSSC